MSLKILDFVQQVDGVTVEDIPDSTQSSLNAVLEDQTGGDGDGGLSNPEGARRVSKNLNGRAGFNRINDAIKGDNGENGAASGTIDKRGTIFVEDGEFNESIAIDVEGLTLEGPNAGTPGDEHSEDAAEINGQVIIGADGAVVDGFTVSPPDPGDDTGEAEAIRVSNDADDVVVQNNIVEDFARNSGSDFFGVDGINLFGGNESDAVENPTVQDNLVQRLQNNVSGGAAGISVQGNVENPTVERNVIEDIGQEETNFGFGVVVRGTGNHDVTPTDVSITDNEISNVLSDPSSEFFGVGAGVEASGADDVSFSGNNISNAELLLEDKTATLTLRNFADNNTLDRGALVENAQVGEDTRNIIFNSIQNAETAAESDDTIEVLAGSYQESVDIDTEGLTLEGPNAGIDGDGSRGEEATIEGPVFVEADNVTVDGFEIQDVNAGDTDTPPGIAAVQLNTLSEGSADGTTVANSIINNTAELDKNFGVTAEEVTDVTIEGNNFVENTDSSTGITGFASPIRFEIKDNTFENSGAGLNVPNGMTATVSNNQFKNNSIGIAALVEFDSLTIENNEFTDNGGVTAYVRDDTGDLNLNTIESNNNFPDGTSVNNTDGKINP